MGFKVFKYYVILHILALHDIEYSLGDKNIAVVKQPKYLGVAMNKTLK